jgi:DNA (cytosine-5)-methyltransferase 1
MAAYYNENGPFAAAWLRILIVAGHIAPGDVDERSIEDVKPDDLRGYEQCHFFAGIGGWSYALRLAGWPDDRPVWTGSCPCQPFSSSGKQKGFDDSRHLWPTWFRLITECSPEIVFGEQVANALAWFDLVSDDMESAGYSVGATDLPACSVGAPHIRQRLWFVGVSDCPRSQSGSCASKATRYGDTTNATSGIVTVADTDDAGLEGRVTVQQRADQCAAGPSSVAGQLGDAECDRCKDAAQQSVDGQGAIRIQSPGWHRGTSVSSPWCDIEWLQCSDGKARPTQPGIFPLANGTTSRVGRLRAYGNAIVPQVAAEFIRAYLAATP